MNAPELFISEDEGDQFMKRAQAVAKHYSVETTQKTLDWIAFGGCAVGMYAPRVVALMMRRRAGQPPYEPPVANGHDPASQFEGQVYDGNAFN